MTVRPLHDQHRVHKELSLPHATWSQDRYIEAYLFAARAHHGQTTPGSQLPYMAHVTLVTMEVLAALRAESGHDENLVVQCALLHDVLEDTATTPAQLQAIFGARVTSGVQALSKDATLPRPVQMADSLRRIRLQPYEVWLVKLADRITNLLPPPAHWDNEHIARYRAEACDILAALGDASPFLAARLRLKIDGYAAYRRPSATS